MTITETDSGKLPGAGASHDIYGFGFRNPSHRKGQNQQDKSSRQLSSQSPNADLVVRVRVVRQAVAESPGQGDGMGRKCVLRVPAEVLGEGLAFVTHPPCCQCARAFCMVGIQRVVIDKKAQLPPTLEGRLCRCPMHHGTRRHQCPILVNHPSTPCNPSTVHS